MTAPAQTHQKQLFTTIQQQVVWVLNLAPVPRSFLRRQSASGMGMLFYGDNLEVMRRHIAGESVDLIYLDPPFNSKASYNLTFRSPAGTLSDSQINAFEDSWHFGPESAQALHDVARSDHGSAAALLAGWQGVLGQNGLMAYLAMMAVRLIEMHRVLKQTGSLYLHCDPTASHYVKTLLDSIFGPTCFRSEISWRRSRAHNDAKQGRACYGNVRDVILFYTKSDEWTWNWQYTGYSDRYVSSAYRHVDKAGARFRRGDLTAAKPGGDVSYRWPVKRLGDGDWEADLSEEWRQPKPDWEYRQVAPYTGRFWAFSRSNMIKLAEQGRLAYARSGRPEYKRYLHEQSGVPLQNDWDDLPPVSGGERLGYPTQKPLALLERIIAASSNPGDVVLDPFCGCGTAVHAAQRLGRDWLGIDITFLAINEIGRRLATAFPGLQYRIVGEPNDLADAEHLARSQPHQFQYWITERIGGRPFKAGRKGADRGIDGLIHYTRNDARPGKAALAAAIISVKAGRNIGVAMIRDLVGVLSREQADFGIFVCAEPPSRDMEREAAAARMWTDPVTLRSYPRVQILTLAQILEGRRPQLPLLDARAGRRAATPQGDASQQALL